MKNNYKHTIAKRFTVFIGLLIFPFSVALAQGFAGESNENYVKTKVYKKATTNSTNSATYSTTNITYYDGLGRPIQQVAHKQSGTGGDLITHIEYDDLGRQEKEYLPYERSSASLSIDPNPTGNITSFYNTFQFGNTENPYSETEFEDSPLNRVLKQAAPGNDWKMGDGHEVKFKYDTNNSNQVYHFKISSTSGTFPTLSYHGKYAAKQLYKTSTYDENNENSSLKGSVVEYKDKLGRVILKRHYTSSTGRTSTTDTNPAVAFDTYYVYDDHGNLSIVLPPKLSEQIVVGSSLASNKQALLDGLGYQYSYDHRNRLIRKQLPGKQAEFISYDSLDRPISIGPTLSPFGDSTLGSTRTKYDVFGRVAYTMWVPGWFGENTRQSIETTSSNTTTLSETRTENATTVNGVQFSYTNDVAPTSGYHILTINYYDDYDWDGAPSIPSTVGNGDSYVHYKNNNNDKPKGLPTGTWVRILESETDTDAKITYTLYDNKARAIRVHTDYTLEGGHTQVDSKYDFIGKVEYTITKHKRTNNSDEEEVRDTYTYDDQQRLEKHTHQIDGEQERLLAKNTYDAIGQLKEKKTGGTDISASTYFQKVDYKYNVRGWLTDINNTNSLNTNPIDLFAFKINYNNKNFDNNVNGQVRPLYNGNIAETSWRTSSDNVLRRYGYSYDYLNRLLDAWYQKPGNSTPVPQSYDEHLTYDSNGNIETLLRHGQYEFNSPIIIDDLTYDYADDSNQLKNVSDLSSNEGFDDKHSGTSGNPDYDYDDFGNLIEDKNKSIDNIIYNHLNLPVKVIFGSDEIEYLYCADGVKLKKNVLENNTTIETAYYDGFQYTDDVNGNLKLDFFPTAEGSVDVSDNGLGTAYNYIYHYLDHLGNIRLRYAKDPDDGIVKILEESHYYPFGLKQEGYNQTRMEFKKDVDNSIVLTEVDPFLGSTYFYGFQGQEHQTELNYNAIEFKFRHYDAAIGRFLQIDPLATTYVYNSTYAFAENNVTSGIDLEGKELSFEMDGNRATGVAGPRAGTKTLQEVRSYSSQRRTRLDYLQNRVSDNRPKATISLPLSHPSRARYAYPQWGGNLGASFGDGAKEAVQDIALGGALNYGLKAFRALRSSSSVWNLNRFKRGRQIEDALGANQQWSKNFPTIDKIDNVYGGVNKISDGVATSIKSLDLTANSYQSGNKVFNTLKGYIDKLDNFGGTVNWGGTTITEGLDYSSKSLEVAFETGAGSAKQWEQIGQAVEYALKKDINFTIRFID